MKKISIIVPVFNAEEHISGTLDSLLKQTYDDIEIICIDDGSVDDSLQVLQAYQSREPEIIRVVSQDNAGVSVARNKGIELAMGSILMFVDADDTLVPNACELVARVFQKSDPEVFTFGFYCNPPELMPLGMNKELKPPEKTYLDFVPALLFEDKARPYFCRTAISKEFVDREHIRFEPNVKLGEDQIIYFVAYPLSRKTILAPIQLYVYTMRDSSATHANASEKDGVIQKVEQHMLVIEAIQREWKERGLTDLCRSELLEWSLDLVLFDIETFPEDQRNAFFARFINGFSEYFENEPSRVAKHFSTKRCLKNIEDNLSKRSSEASLSIGRYVSIPNLALFYYHRYGFIRCFQQLLIGLGVLKKWK